MANFYYSVQAEDGVLTLAVNDTSVTEIRDPDNPESNASLNQGLRPNFTGTGYVDFGDDSGDTLTQTVTLQASANTVSLAILPVANTGPIVDRVDVTALGDGSAVEGASMLRVWGTA